MRWLVWPAVAVLVIAEAGNGLYLYSVESAAVKVTVPAWPLDVWAVVHGAPAGGDFQTQRLEATVTETATGTATGIVATPATHATGYVVFKQGYCPPQDNCTLQPAKPGYEVCRLNPSGYGAWCYVLQTAVTCYCGEHVPVVARGPGSSFNAPANTVTYPGWAYGIAFVTVTNPAPISGGTDRVSYTVVTQADVDAVAATVRARVSADLKSSLQSQAQGLHYVADTTPAIIVSSDVAPGSRGDSFQVTVSGSVGATAFRDADARKAIQKALDTSVPRGFRISNTGVISDYQVQDSSAEGGVTVTGEASSYLVSNFSVESLRSSLRGQNVAAARRAIGSAAPGSVVQIRLTPFPALQLPLDANHISITVVLRPVTYHS